MTTMGIRDPRIAQGFGALADAMFPNPARLAQASYLGARREQALAQAGLADAQSSQTWNDVDGARALFATINQPGFDPAIMENRARMVALSALRRDGLRDGPQFAAQATGVINPDTPNLSTILTSGGAHFQNTPQGQQLTRDNALAVARIQNDGRVQAAEAAANARVAAAEARAAGGGGGQPRRVSPQDAAALRESITNRLVESAGGGRVTIQPTNLEIEPLLMDTLLGNASQRFQETGDPVRAVQDALRGAPITFENTSGVLPWSAERRRARLGPTSPASAQPAQGQPPVAAAGQAQAAPAGAPAPAGARHSEGDVLHNPRTGERIVLRNNQWVPLR